MNQLESSEDYLERILMLSKKLDLVRAIDIAIDMSYSKPSVSIALKKLKNKNYITVDNKTGSIELTTSGMQIAQYIYHRHETLSTLLINIGVSPEVAMQDACKIEHDLSDETFSCIEKHLKRHN